MTIVVASPVTLWNWQEMIKSIYHKKDQRDYSDADLLLHVVEETAKVDEGLRKEEEAEIREALPRVFIWLLSFCVRRKIQAEEVLWGKYRGRCPYCGVLENCICVANNMSIRIRSDPKDTRPSSLREWQAMFDRIYGRVNRLLDKVNVWLHFHEEIGELSREFRLLDSQKGDQKLKDELADAFAWLLGFCNRLGIDLGKLAYEMYPGVCDECKRPVCTCPKV